MHKASTNGRVWKCSQKLEKSFSNAIGRTADDKSCIITHNYYSIDSPDILRLDDVCLSLGNTADDNEYVISLKLLTNYIGVEDWWISVLLSVVW